MDKIKIEHIQFDIIVADEFHKSPRYSWVVTDDPSKQYIYPNFSFESRGTGSKNMSYAEDLLGEWVKENYPDKAYIIYYWWWS